MADTDLKKAVDALAAKHRAHTLRWRYYDGDHPIAFVNPKIAEVIDNGTVFKQNLCQVVINATRDRLRIQSWNHPEKATADKLADLWRTVLRKTATQIHVAALTTGESYLIVWPRQDGRVAAYYHDPRQAHVMYEDDDPYTPRMGVKTWLTEENRFLNLYYTDRIEHYVAAKEASSHGEYRATEQGVESNPYNQIPVFHFRMNPRINTGELTLGVLSIQDGLNKLLNDLMVSSEYCAFPQRWSIGNWDTSSKLPIGPGIVTQFPAGQQGDQPASVGTFATSDPRNHLDPIENLTYSMAFLTATPKHYFLGQDGTPSGEALRAMEAPLIAKVQQYNEVLTDVWSQAAAFALMVEGVKADVEDIEVIWTDPQTIQPQSQAMTRQTNTAAGIPIKNQLRDEGWTDEQLTQLDQDKAEEVTRQAAAQVPAMQPRGAPQTREQAQPMFDGIVRTPDMAGVMAETGMLARAVNRARGNVGA